MSVGVSIAFARILHGTLARPLKFSTKYSRNLDGGLRSRRTRRLPVLVKLLGVPPGRERLRFLAKRRGAAIARTKRASRRTPSRTPGESRMAGVAGVRRTHRTTQP